MADQVEASETWMFHPIRARALISVVVTVSMTADGNGGLHSVSGELSARWKRCINGTKAVPSGIRNDRVADGGIEGLENLGTGLSDNARI